MYLIAMLGVGFYFMRRNKSQEDYYVGGRNMSAGHVGLSVVATDVGGGFSIGLGGLGFVMGISGSWMLFTGLLGAWLASVFLIPKVYDLSRKNLYLSFPQALNYHYGPKVALLAGILSLIGYTGFTSSQILAGAKLGSATFPAIDINTAVLSMGIIAVVYTVIGGIKAVIYTDTVQWIILMAGLIFIGIPLGYLSLGGWDSIKNTLQPEFLQLSNIQFSQILNWLFTILPIWFVGMTLYQRIYSCKDEKTAKKAWRIAGLFEWPVMAFMGVILGLFARVALEQGMFLEYGYDTIDSMDAELGLPLFLREILPIGLTGLMMSAYFSAIMSTADSCLVAASGNLITDVLIKFRFDLRFNPIRLSQVATFLIGTIAIILATLMNNVLELMLYSYAIMVSGLLVPVLAMLSLKKPSAHAALWSMLTGGSITIGLIMSKLSLPYELDPIIFGISGSAICFLIIQTFNSKTRWPSSH